MLCTVTLKNNVLYLTYIVVLLFLVFDLGTRATCDTNYLEIYNVDQVTGKSSFVSKYCGGVSVNLSFAYYSFMYYNYYSLLCCEYKAQKNFIECDLSPDMNAQKKANKFIIKSRRSQSELNKNLK